MTSRAYLTRAAGVARYVVEQAAREEISALSPDEIAPVVAKIRAHVRGKA